MYFSGVTGMGTGGSGMGTATGSVVGGAGLGHNSVSGVIQGNGVINRSGQDYSIFIQFTFYKK